MFCLSFQTTSTTLKKNILVSNHYMQSLHYVYFSIKNTRNTTAVNEIYSLTNRL